MISQLKVNNTVSEFGDGDVLTVTGTAPSLPASGINFFPQADENLRVTDLVDQTGCEILPGFGL
ncbi:MAG: hypothetical protein ABIK54_02885 [candidate division WOR-3 bacterium]